jgi:DNA-binding NarL/FixJ family response regulator
MIKVTHSKRKRKLQVESPNQKVFDILIIDDHPTQVAGYTSILREVMSDKIDITRCFTFEDAFSIVSSGLIAPDLIFLDMTMPAFAEKGIFTGEDMAQQIRSYLPKSRLVIITAHSETFFLYNLVKNIQPEGILIKSDFHARELQEAVNTVMRNETYHSATVRNGIKALLHREKYLDFYNRQIIMLLAQGIKTKHLPEYISISLSAIEKRKAQLKDYFCIDQGSDDQIVNEARKLGFI